MGNWSNRSNGNRGSWGGGSQPVQQQAPATQTVLTSGKRMVVINAYSRNDGQRMAQVSFCEIAAVPEAIAEMGDTRIYGVQTERAFLTVPEALKAAEEWLSGAATKSATL